MGEEIFPSSCQDSGFELFSLGGFLSEVHEGAVEDVVFASGLNVFHSLEGVLDEPVPDGFLELAGVDLYEIWGVYENIGGVVMLLGSG